MHASINHAIAIALTCGAAAGTASAQVIFDNGPWQTGASTQSGIPAPSGSVWSEVANDSGQTTIANTVTGFPVSGQSRIADNFVVPPGPGWGLNYVQVPVIEPGAVAPTVTAATIRIWNGPPNAGGVVVFGDTVTNRFSGAGFVNVYRCPNTIVPAICGGPTAVPAPNLHVQGVLIAISTNLSPGSYWVDYSISGVTGALATTVAGTRQPGGPASNALQFNGSWSPLADPGQGCNPTPVTQEAAFSIFGTQVPFPNCYANCDSSTVIPCLNVNDFLCFSNLFAAGDSYANCDNSSFPPILNVNDFSCFLGKYGLGCVQNCMPPQ